jgi:protein tyrosine phosphatase
VTLDPDSDDPEAGKEAGNNLDLAAQPGPSSATAEAAKKPKKKYNMNKYKDITPRHSSRVMERKTYSDRINKKHTNVRRK